VKDKEKKKDDVIHDSTKRAPKNKAKDEVNSVNQEELFDKHVDMPKNRDIFFLKSKKFLSKQNPFGIELYTKRDLYEENERTRIDQILKMQDLKQDLSNQIPNKDVKFEIKYHKHKNRHRPTKSRQSNRDKDSIDQMQEDYQVEHKLNTKSDLFNVSALKIETGHSDQQTAKSIYDADAPTN